MKTLSPVHSKLKASVLWIFGIGLSYLLLSGPALHLSGKWPAPYWLSVGLGALLAYGLTSRKPGHLVWVVPFVCLAALTAWFFDLGVHQDWFRGVFSNSLHRYFRYHWARKVPIVVLMSVFVILTNSNRRAQELIPSVSAFALLLLAFLFPAEPLCSLSLPHPGNFPHGDYDAFGCRLGGYFLGAIALCLIVLQFALFKSSDRHDEKAV